MLPFAGRDDVGLDTSGREDGLLTRRDGGGIVEEKLNVYAGQRLRPVRRLRAGQVDDCLGGLAEGGIHRGTVVTEGPCQEPGSVAGEGEAVRRAGRDACIVAARQRKVPASQPQSGGPSRT